MAVLLTEQHNNVQESFMFQRSVKALRVVHQSLLDHLAVADDKRYYNRQHKLSHSTVYDCQYNRAGVL